VWTGRRKGEFCSAGKGNPALQLIVSYVTFWARASLHLDTQYRVPELHTLPNKHNSATVTRVYDGMYSETSATIRFSVTEICNSFEELLV
jgi:hypothetical protein